jgi:hypothetical protein
MAQFGRPPTVVDKPRVRTDEISKVSEEISSIERDCERMGFDSEVVEDIGGLLTLGVCSNSGISLESDRLGVSLLDEDRRMIESDMMNRIRLRSTYLERAAEEVLGPLLRSTEGRGALSYWTTINRRLGSSRIGFVEQNWLREEEGRQDSVLMKSAGKGFSTVLDRNARGNALKTFSKIRRAGNRVPVLAKLFRF